MNGKILKNRISAVRRRLKKKRASCLIVTKPANVTYTTGFLGDDSWAVITGRSVCLLTDSRYIEQAKQQCPNCRIIERTGSIAEAAAKLLKKLNSAQTPAVEKSASPADSEALKKKLKAR